MYLIKELDMNPLENKVFVYDRLYIYIYLHIHCSLNDLTNK